MKKIRVAILFGGKSAEHEVSVRSARTIINAIDQTKYDVFPIALDKSGACLSGAATQELLADNETAVTAALPGETHLALPSQSLPDTLHERVDVVFPVLHGTSGEDGAMQGLLKLANIPFVGAGVLGSAVGMDKDVMKRLLKEAGIPVARWRTVDETNPLSFKDATAALGAPLFIKPANLGSSIGVSKATTEEEYATALQHAFQFDTKVIVEEYIAGREIECSVLGNEAPKASVPGEIIVKSDFYSYDTKYLDENGARLEIPARIPAETTAQIQALAIKTFKVLCCQGMGRVDFFLKPDGSVLVNEINTIPGFTSVSMYPKLWEASGLSITELIDQLIQLALARFERESKLQTSISVAAGAKRLAPAMAVRHKKNEVENQPQHACTAPPPELSSELYRSPVRTFLEGGGQVATRRFPASPNPPTTAPSGTY